MSYLKNTWYVAAWADELTQTELLSCRLLGENIVFFRDRDNNPAALIDRCAHRFAALSMGRIKNNCIECPYHGLRFSAAGECTHNPHGDGRIPSRSRVRAFPVVERYNAIWIWMGEPEKANADDIPVFEFMQPNDFYIGTGSMKVEGNYQLETDNIMDLSHIEFVHPMFSSPAVSRGKFSHEIVANTVWSRRDICNDTSPPDFIRTAFDIAEGPVDRWLHVHWQAPACMALYAGGVASGQSRDKAVVSTQVHWFTPETERSTHYFYALAMPRSSGEAGAECVRHQAENLYMPFKMEDAPIIEVQQKNIGEIDIMELQPLVLDVDAAGHAARRILARMIEQEKRPED